MPDVDIEATLRRWAEWADEEVAPVTADEAIHVAETDGARLIDLRVRRRDPRRAWITIVAVAAALVLIAILVSRPRSQEPVIDMVTTPTTASTTTSTSPVAPVTATGWTQSSGPFSREAGAPVAHRGALIVTDDAPGPGGRGLRVWTRNPGGDWSDVVLVPEDDPHPDVSPELATNGRQALLIPEPVTDPDEYVGTAFISEDGRTWNPVAEDGSGLTKANLHQVAGGDRGFVVTGQVHSDVVVNGGFTSTQMMWHSEDGRNWASAPTSAMPTTAASTRRPAGATDPIDTSIDHLLASSDGFLAVGTIRGYIQGTNWTVPVTWLSSDGVTWHEVERSALDRPRRSVVAQDGGGFLATVSPDDYVPGEPHTYELLESKDGLRWTPIPLPDAARTVTNGVTVTGSPHGLVLITREEMAQPTGASPTVDPATGPERIQVYVSGDRVHWESFTATVPAPWSPAQYVTTYPAAVVTPTERGFTALFGTTLWEWQAPDAPATAETTTPVTAP